MRPLLLALSCASCLPIASVAQSPPRLYVGAAATLFRFAPFESFTSSYVGPAVTAGVAVNARWALEASAQYVQRNRSYSDSNVSPGGNINTYNSTFDTYVLLVPLLARYTFTTASSPLHVDGLGGLSYFYASNQYSTTSLVNGVESGSKSGSKTNNLAVTLGPQLRYAITSHFDAKLSLPINLQLTNTTSFSNALSLSPQLGVQYTFGK